MRTYTLPTEPLRRKVFVESYRYEVRTVIFDAQGELLDVRTAIAVVNTEEDDAIVVIMHPDTFNDRRIAFGDILATRPHLAIYNPKAK